MASDTAQRLFDYLPIYYGGDEPDPIVIRWLEAMGFETERARTILEQLRDYTIPITASDVRGALSRWERAFGLPVAPAGATEGQRRAALTGYLRARIVVYGRDWTSAMEAAIGSPRGVGWQAFAHTPGPNQLTLEIPYVEGSFTAGQVEALARRRTPANLEIIMRYEAGFIVGVSRVGDAI